MEEEKVATRPIKNRRKHVSEEKNEIQEAHRQQKRKIGEKFKLIDSNLVNEVQEEVSLEDQLQHQLEFYLGDVNLRKDKFLRELLSKNDKGYVELNEFLKFNKIKGLLESIPTTKEKLEALANALSHSELLKVNKGQTRVKRKIPFMEKVSSQTQEQIDKKTVYIENIPEDINHETLAKIFSKCGKILHVSLPKYAESKTIKGFGFIEFAVSVSVIIKQSKH